MIKIFDPVKKQVVDVEKVERSEAEWRKLLTREQFHIMRGQGTEIPFSCPLVENHEAGLYKCRGCGTALFASNGKFESGTGWPSFWEPVSPLNLTLKNDSSLGVKRVEVLCARCGSHLGHVFDDGPPPTGKRYCINGEAVEFVLAR